MSSKSQNVFELAAHELAVFLDPVLEACDSPNKLFAFFAERGWRLGGLLKSDLTSVVTAIGTVRTSLQQLSTTGAADSLSGLLDLLSAFGGALEGIRGLRGALSDLAMPGMDAAVAEALGTDLLEYLILWYAAARFPAVVQLATVLTIVDDQLVPALTSQPGGSGDLLRVPLYRPTLMLDNLGQLLRDPLGRLKQAYMPQAGIATEADARTFAQALFPRLQILVQALRGTAQVGLFGAPAADLLDPANEPLQRIMTFLFPVGSIGSAVSDDSPAAQASIGMTVAVIPASAKASFGPQGPGLEIDPLGVVSFEFPLGRWILKVQAGGQVGKVFVNSSSVRFADAAASTADVAVALSSNSGQAPAFLLGANSGTRLEIGNLQLSGDVHFHGQQPDYGAMVEVGSAAFVMAAGDGDGFLQKVLPKELNVGFNFAIGWSNSKGLYFRGGAGLELTLPVNKSLLGVIAVKSIYIAIKSKDSDIELAAATTGSLELGPLSATVDRVGLRGRFSFPATGGNLGIANLDVAFKFPDGIGLVINATAVVGGGYLFFDTEKEQYAGILQLEIVKTIAIKAIGLLTTRMPDGSKGFSLLVIITAEGFGPIQLGFGFTLTGIGGLLGVNRTCVVDTLRSGIKNGTVGSILFPQDPVRNAQRIVSDVGSVFPPALHRYVFGPMVKINWGTPPILTMEIGLVLEVPDPIRLLILGRLLAVLPEEEAALVRIRMDSLGVIDFGKGEISLDATLYDSRILTFVLTGDMALRANFGTNPGFLLSVGGWNPAFPSPPGFPLLSRMAITLSSSDNARLRLESYMAITSNTVQFGASVDLYFAVQPFSLEGYLGFDALFHFSPFSLQANLSASVTIRMNGAILMSVGLDATLTGPSPWHIWGSAHFSVLCFKQSVSFDVQYGSAPPPALPPAVDVKSLLTAALNDVRNWSSELPAGERPLVIFRATAADASVLSVHPLAELAVRERVAPLDMTISKFGSAPVSGDNTFSLKAVRSDGTEIPSVEKITDSFALAQFEDMSDDQKLSSPSFVQETAGIRFTTGEFAFGYEPALDSSITYTTLMIVPEQPAKTLPAYTMPAAVLDGAITSGAAAQASKKRPSGLGVRAA